MKKLWKALGITALAAALLPYRVRKDQDEDATTIDALLWQATRRPGQGEEKGQVDITIGFKSPLQEVRQERALFTDDPEEAVLFADHEPEAAVIQHEANVAEHEAAVAEHEAAVAEHEAAVAEHEAAVAEHEAASAEEEAGEADFDPEL